MLTPFASLLSYLSVASLGGGNSELVTYVLAVIIAVGWFAGTLGVGYSCSGEKTAAPWAIQVRYLYLLPTSFLDDDHISSSSRIHALPSL